MRVYVELEIEIEDSARSPRDTRARAMKVGRSIVDWAGRLRHSKVVTAQIEEPHGRIHRLTDREEPDA